ncbi:hypothetical protein P344_01665 [Spiroplasma mirum ATCC 29335]|uniref:Ribosomal RNA large subunit methyltransferase H n=1 Tax=Spiroplasma mirum ATCC 29335 TaxID=838561 RepID=W0GNT4_9MOLU|nr:MULTISPECIES: 23S rRNA (pseudouridine(1915)-N(3))-methyltransferase RlmH [Spiroplasma]AHF60723.1 hypothetical protein SMM_0272 [Spiroplasma mirum ATCC 29335]AHI57695.1 hypothetical protein P344_01665 [Spiroplasma mirum ATCC 29335]AKM52841.1 rRNA large subunit methyltransferase [Spiroplasma atrichopogonis]
MDIKIIVVGTLDKNYLTEGNNLFLTRIKNYSKIEIIELKEISQYDVAKNIKAQTSLVSDKLSNYSEYVKVLLDINGKQLTSLQLANFIQEVKDFQNAKLAFIIGSSDGLDQNLLPKVNYRLSLGLITLPHQLCRLILLEQIYRSFKIINNEKYHK